MIVLKEQGETKLWKLTPNTLWFGFVLICGAYPFWHDTRDRMLMAMRSASDGIFFFFFGATPVACVNFQGLKPHLYSSGLRCSSDSAGSLTTRPPGNSLKRFFLIAT